MYRCFKEPPRAFPFQETGVMGEACHVNRYPPAKPYILFSLVQILRSNPTWVLLVSPVDVSQFFFFFLLTGLEERGQARMALWRMASVFFQGIILRSGLWVDSWQGGLLSSNLRGRSYCFYQGEEATAPGPELRQVWSFRLFGTHPSKCSRASGPYQGPHLCMENLSHLHTQAWFSVQSSLWPHEKRISLSVAMKDLGLWWFALSGRWLTWACCFCSSRFPQLKPWSVELPISHTIQVLTIIWIITLPPTCTPS